MDKFIYNRLAEIEDGIEITQKRKLLESIEKMETYIACLSCGNYDKGLCGLNGNTIPAAILNIGCEKAIDKPPF